MNDEFDRKVLMICRLPVEFRERGNITVGELLRRAGYRHGDSLCPEDLVPTLRSYPAWIDAWFGWSDDKRTTGGWFLCEIDGHFGVGRFGQVSDGTAIEFDDRARAAAEFIIREIDNVSTPVSTLIRDRLVHAVRKR